MVEVTVCCKMYNSVRVCERVFPSLFWSRPLPSLSIITLWMASAGTVHPPPLRYSTATRSPAVKSPPLQRHDPRKTDLTNWIQENSVCLYVAACTRQTHAASQSTVPPTAYAGEIYKGERRNKLTLSIYVGQINTHTQMTHAHTHANSKLTHLHTH